MPPRNYKESASEPESTRNNNSSNVASSSKTSQKAKNQAALQAQQMFLSKHINSNGPNDKPKVHPLDFESFDDSTLMRYSEKYGLNVPIPESVNFDILNSEIGKKTYSKRNKLRQNINRVSKPELAAHLKNHFMSLPSKENEIITGFLYKLKHEDSEFRLKFN